MKDGGLEDWVPTDPIPNKQWVVVTFEDLKLQVKIEGDKAVLLSSSGGDIDDAGNDMSWAEKLKPYGTLRPGISHLRLRRGDDPSDSTQDIIAVINEIDQINPNIASIDIDENSLPAASIPPVNAIINPTRSGPGKGLPTPALGQRYLVLVDVPNSTVWGITNAKANDIIEYNGSGWVVSFNSSSTPDATVLNTMTGLLYEWRYGQWISAYEGAYKNGWWRIYL
jgi:hypothetical protein